MKKVILNFKTEVQAEKFFESFAGIKGENTVLKEKVENAIDDILNYCEVSFINTKKENSSYKISAS